MRRLHVNMFIGCVELGVLLLLNACTATRPQDNAGITQVAPTLLSIASVTITPVLDATSAEQTIGAIVDRRFTQAFQTQRANTATQAVVNTVDIRVHALQTATAQNAPTNLPTPTLDPTENELTIRTAVANRATEIEQAIVVQTQVAATYASRDALLNRLLTATAQFRATLTPAPLDSTALQSTLDSAIARRLTEIALQTQANAQFNTRVALVDPLLTLTAQYRATPTPVPLNSTALQSTLDSAIARRLTEIALQTQANAQFNTRVALVDPLLTATALGIIRPTAALQTSRGDLTKSLEPITLENAIRTAEVVSFSGSAKAISGLVFAPDGFTLAVSGGDNTVRIFDTLTTVVQNSFVGNTDRAGVAYSPDGQLIAAPSSDGTVRILESLTGLQRFVLEQPVIVATGRRRAMTSAAFSPDGLRLATGNADGTIIIWNMKEGRKILTLTVPRGIAYGITTVVFSADGTRIAAGNEIGQVAFWESVTNFQISSLRGDGSATTGLILSADGKLVISASRSGEILVREVAAGALKVALRNTPVVSNSISINADFNLLAVASGDGVIRLYDLLNNKLIASLKGHPAPASVVAFSPDGFRLASGGEDGSIRLWAVPKG